jgi:hypothetical protein
VGAQQHSLPCHIPVSHAHHFANLDTVEHSVNHADAVKYFLSNY